MELYEREFFISRIIAGYYKLSFGGEAVLIQPPTRSVVYEANQIYVDTYNEALEREIMQDEDIHLAMLQSGLWSEDNDKKLEYLPNHVDHWKVEIYNAVFQEQKREQMRKYLNTAKDVLHDLLLRRHAYDYVTCHGVASYAKTAYIVEQSSFFPDGKPYDWGGISLFNALNYYQSNIISEANLRQLARTEPWVSIWSSSKKIGDTFGVSGVDLTLEQRRLILWSSLYDNVSEAHDSPSEDVIKDDDALDGWLIVKRKEREREQAKQQGESMIKNPKIAGADEIYIKAQTVEDARKVDMMNSVEGQIIKKQRLALMAKKGQVKEGEFADTKQKTMLALNQAQIQHAKGRK